MDRSALFGCVPHEGKEGTAGKPGEAPHEKSRTREDCGFLKKVSGA